MKWLFTIGMLVVSLLAPLPGGWLGPVGQPVTMAAAALAAGAAPADTMGTLTVNGYDRHYLYVVSAAAAPGAGRPLVIFLHGDGGSLGLSAAWRLAVLADANGAVLLSAEGRNNI